VDRRVRTERRCGYDRRKLLYLHRRIGLDLRSAFRDI
jgi:hypothetical protein